jgi:hemerythrin
MKSQAVVWSKEYDLDLPEVDVQHQWLFALINRLWGTPQKTGNKAR